MRNASSYFSDENKPLGNYVRFEIYSFCQWDKGWHNLWSIRIKICASNYVNSKKLMCVKRGNKELAQTTSKS